MHELNGGHPDVFKDRIQALHQSNMSYSFYLLSLHGRRVSTSSRSSSGPNLKIQILHNLTHKMQIGISVAYNVCEVKPDKTNHWVFVGREDFSVAMVY